MSGVSALVAISVPPVCIQLAVYPQLTVRVPLAQEKHADSVIAWCDSEAGSLTHVEFTMADCLKCPQPKC